MKTKALKNYLNILYPVLSLAVFFAAWYIIAGIIDIEIILPSPTQCLRQLGQLAVTKEFWTAIGGTLTRAMLSFAMSMSAALALAALSAFFKPIGKLLSPLVIITRAMPTMSVILLSLIWFTAQITPMFISFLIIFPTLFTSFYSAFTNIDEDLIEMAKVYKVGRRQKLTELYLPSIFPLFFDAVRAAVSLNIKLVIAAEVLSYTRDSMGVMMQFSKAYLETASLFAWTIAAIILSYLLEMAVVLLKKLVVRWK
jgi:NitT/TauT family transport system permease protein